MAHIVIADTLQSQVQSPAPGAWSLYVEQGSVKAMDASGTSVLIGPSPDSLLDPGTFLGQVPRWDGTAWAPSSNIIVDESGAQVNISLSLGLDSASFNFTSTGANTDSQVQIGPLNSGAAASAGMLRWESSRFEAYDGTAWKRFANVDDGGADWELPVWDSGSGSWVGTGDASITDVGALSASALELSRTGSGPLHIASVDGTYSLGGNGTSATVSTTGNNEDIVLDPDGSGRVVIGGAETVTTVAGPLVLGSATDTVRIPSPTVLEHYYDATNYAYEGIYKATSTSTTNVVLHTVQLLAGTNNSCTVILEVNGVLSTGGAGYSGTFVGGARSNGTTATSLGTLQSTVRENFTSNPSVNVNATGNTLQLRVNSGSAQTVYWTVVARVIINEAA